MQNTILKYFTGNYIDVWRDLVSQTNYVKRGSDKLTTDLPIGKYEIIKTSKSTWKDGSYTLRVKSLNTDKTHAFHCFRILDLILGDAPERTDHPIQSFEGVVKDIGDDEIGFWGDGIALTSDGTTELRNVTIDLGKRYKVSVHEIPHVEKPIDNEY